MTSYNDIINWVSVSACLIVVLTLISVSVPNFPLFTVDFIDRSKSTFLSQSWVESTLLKISICAGAAKI